ncbi:multidrug effflux MFS transporter [Anaeromyxobacter oryzae]|uniref:Bcr/CflA family drug resistance efflux transporter n=1 Tax=Anaeromyxobacter oryzae TaxID=2918170 RepID=A0ABN6MM43_9BACT|nr:multidrug effflux MFS transporter [Anaeromyxobacter oryzae]BDG02123.1 Bcr/CflA family drug resistance efflux transporter [Anaeromyxobacter oryzae]
MPAAERSSPMPLPASDVPGAEPAPGAGALRHPMASLRVGALLTGIVGIGALSIDTYLPSLPQIVREFRTADATAQLTVTLFLLSFAATQLVFGPLSDRFGRRRTLLGGLLLYVVGAIGCALAPTIQVLVVARVVQGLGAGSGPVVGRAIVRDVYPREHGARVLALMATAQALTPILAPILGGYVQVWSGWRAVFVILVVLGTAFLAAAWALVAETVPGVEPGVLHPRTLLRNAGTLMHDRTFVGYVLAVMLVFSGQFAFISGSAFVFIGLLKVSPDAYGYCFGLVAFGLMTGSFVTARVTGRLGVRRVVRAGALLAAVSGVALAAPVLLGVTRLPSLLLPMYLYAVAGGLVMPSAMAGAIGPFAGIAGLASAVLGFFQMAGSAAYAIAVSRFLDGTARPMTVAIALSGLACLAACAALVRPGPRDEA